MVQDFLKGNGIEGRGQSNKEESTHYLCNIHPSETRHAYSFSPFLREQKDHAQFPHVFSSEPAHLPNRIHNLERTELRPSPRSKLWCRLHLCGTSEPVRKIAHIFINIEPKR